MSRNPDRKFDKTYLSADAADERCIIHRDLIAHALRWSHVAMYLRKSHLYQKARILDIGCGIEMPLAKTLYVNRMIPEAYAGVDINKLEVPEMLSGKKMPVSVFGNTDINAVTAETLGFIPNVVVAFEMAEHVQPEYFAKMLTHLLEITDPDTVFFLSTPCFNGSAADNHINEMNYDALGALIEDRGWVVDDHFGTFANIKDYDTKIEETLDAAHLATFNRLREYHDTNIIANMWAPLFPSRSRNVLWRLKKPGLAGAERKFKPLLETPQPWGQSPHWDKLGATTLWSVPVVISDPVP